jgi:hypothetical protein
MKTIVAQFIDLAAAMVTKVDLLTRRRTEAEVTWSLATLLGTFSSGCARSAAGFEESLRFGKSENLMRGMRLTANAPNVENRIFACQTGKGLGPAFMARAPFALSGSA